MYHVHDKGRSLHLLICIQNFKEFVTLCVNKSMQKSTAVERVQLKAGKMAEVVKLKAVAKNCLQWCL